MNKEVVKCIISGDTLSNILGLCSSIVWFFVLIPQLFINYKKQNSDAISLSLILLWIVGDIFSMISAKVKGISSVVIYIAIYHLVIGVLFVIQVIYYRYLNKYHNDHFIPLIWNVNDVQYDEQFDEQFDEFINNKKILYHNEKIFLVVSTMIIILSLFIIEKPFVADIIGWMASFIFICSRIPQIYLNHQRKSTEGLSIYSFIIVNIANLLFLASILVNLCDTYDTTTFIIDNLQWILGSSVTVFFDLIIFYQFQLYSLL